MNGPSVSRGTPAPPATTPPASTPPWGTPVATAYAPPPPLGSRLVARFWRRPRGVDLQAPVAVLVGTAAVALLTAVTLPAPAGLQWPLLTAAGSAVAWRAGRRRRPIRAHRADQLMTVLVVALAAVPAIRTSGPTVALCLVAAVGLGAFTALGGRDWFSVWLTPAVLTVAAVRAVPWAGRGVRRTRLPSAAGAWTRGLVAAAVLVWVCGALLASADDAFAGLLSTAAPDVEPRTLPARVALAGLATVLTLATAHAAAAPPRWSSLRLGGLRRARSAVEWLLPVLALDVLLGVFLLVQAAVLFGAYPEALVSGDATPAERARQGFGQLVALTLVVAALLGWAARRGDPERPGHRRLLGVAGGALLALELVVVMSALRRLWLYEETFGWTVMRLDVGVFEIWLGVAVLVSALAWAVRRTPALPRLVVASAGTVLLVLGVAGPDALVASWNVHRFERTGQLDLDYARLLSDDAVPALAQLPEPQRSCVLGGRAVPNTPWYALNLSREQARAVLAGGDVYPAPSAGVPTCPPLRE